MSQSLLDNLNWLAIKWSAWMLTMSLQVALLVAVLMVLTGLLSRFSGRLRFTIWLLVLLRLVVPPDLAAPTGWMWWTGGWMPIDQWMTLGDWGTAAELTVDSPSTSTMAAGQQPTQVDSRAANEPRMAAGERSAIASWSVILFLIWLGVVAAQLAWLTYGWFLVRRWTRHALPIDDRCILRLLANAQQRVELDCQVQLRNSGRCSTPMIVGWRRPVILLPGGLLESLTLPELETVLVHELTHLKRGDCTWRLLQASLGMLYFFHPAVWIARRYLSRTCEEACDEQTVQALAGKRRDYAEAIFKAAAVVGYQGPYLALNMLGDTLPVKYRLSRILDPRLPLDSAGGWRHALFVLVLGLILLPAGARQSAAIPPQSARLSDIRSSTQPIPPAQSNMPAQPGAPAMVSPQADAPNVIAATDSTVLATESAEQVALQQLTSDQFDVRMRGYATLAEIGTTDSLTALESAFLNRSGLEQDAAEQALKRVWSLIRSQASQVTNSAKLFQSSSEN